MISYIVPVYNSFSYLKKCVQSILNQTFCDYEILLINDGSNDGSGQLCDDLCSLDNRIRTYHKENGGAGSARKYGVSRAKGEWIMFVDSDDTITPTSTELLLSIDNGYDLIAGAINKDGKLFGHTRDGVFNREEYIQSLLSSETTDGPVAKLIRRELFENINWDTSSEITLNEDMLMLIALAINARKIYLSTEVVCYNYISRPGSASSSYSMSFDTWIKLFNLIEKLLHGLLINNPNLQKAFLNYRLERIHNFIIYNNNGLNGNDYLKMLIDESKQFSLNKKEKHVVDLLTNSFNRYWEYYQYKLKIYQLRLLVEKKAKIKIQELN